MSIRVTSYWQRYTLMGDLPWCQSYQSQKEFPETVIMWIPMWLRGSILWIIRNHPQNFAIILTCFGVSPGGTQAYSSRTAQPESSSDIGNEPVLTLARRSTSAWWSLYSNIFVGLGLESSYHISLIRRRCLLLYLITFYYDDYYVCMCLPLLGRRDWFRVSLSLWVEKWCWWLRRAMREKQRSEDPRRSRESRVSEIKRMRGALVFLMEKIISW